jgi:hypothetical protein
MRMTLTTTTLTTTMTLTITVEVPQETGDVTGSTEPRRVSVWRGNNADGTRCSAEFVTVPASQGGEATIRIVRC